MVPKAGAAAMAGPDGNYIFVPIHCSIFARPEHERFHSPRDSFGVALVDFGQFRAGPVN
jgi:hypothetical protein